MGCHSITLQWTKITRLPLDVLSTELSMAFSPSNPYLYFYSGVNFCGEKICGNFILWELIFADREKTRTRRASRGHEAARSEKLLRLLSDRAQTLHNDRTFYSKQSYRFCFFILTVFGGEMTSQC